MDPNNAPYRFEVTMTHAQFNFRVQAHKTDENLLVVKAKHPEALEAFAAVAGGVDPGIVKSLGKGYSNFITFVQRDKFLPALTAFVGKIAAPKGPDPEAASYDSEDGNDIN